MKRSTLAFILIPLFCLLTSSCRTAAPEPVKGHFETSLRYDWFIDPPQRFRSHPFSSINDRLDPNEMKRQVRGLAEAGFGGFYLHSRDGLITEFLSDSWWENMQAALEEGNAQGLQTMFYDEDKWPSGFAGGIVPEMSESYRAKCLARLSIDTPLPAGSKILKSDDKYNYVEHTAQMGNPKFNGTCYVDLMNPEMVRAFIEVGYKPYIEKYGPQATDYTPAIFSDEPHIHARYFDRKTPNLGLYSYSPYVRDKFKDLFGYDVLDKIDLLFEEKDNWRQVRLQYHQAVALQFEESFTQQVAAYCQENGFMYTGHYLAEDVLQKVRDRAGNTMLHYRNMAQPGMDLLGLGFDHKLITARALSSVANQYAIPKRLTEVFGISGQNMNFEDRKWLAGWQAINGVNHFCPHLTLYSLKGLRKRDYPPTFSYHQPYFKYNPQVENYLGRIAYAATIGQYCPQLLVINPLESEFIKGSEGGEFTSTTLALLEQLQAAHYDYDLGDEQIISDIARIDQGRFVIGSMQYEAVILPDMTELRSTTLDLLMDFIQQGGKVINTGRFPQYIDGHQGHENQRASLQSQCVDIPTDQLARCLADVVPPRVILQGENGTIWSHCRSTQNGSLILLYNTDRTESQTFTLASQWLGSDIVLWDPSQGQCFGLDIDSSDDCVELSLAPSSMVWLSTGDLSQQARSVTPYSLPPSTRPLVELKNKWKGQRLTPNAITLDFARYSTDNGVSFSDPEPVIGIFDRLNKQQYNGPLTLAYSFITDFPPNQIQLSIEQPDLYSSIQINGQDVTFSTNTYFIDHQFPVATVTEWVQPGRNEIQLQCDFKHRVDDSRIATERYGTEIESIYLLGDFAVQAAQVETTYESQRNQTGQFQPRPVHGLSQFSLTQERSQFDSDLTLEGYPFFAGEFELQQSFTIESLNDERYFIEFPNCEAINILVKVNGQDIGMLSWAPYQLEITDALISGENQVTLTLVNSLRNLLGPHHQQRAELTRVGPYSFKGTGGFPDPRGDKNWEDLRLTDAPLRLWTDTYTHIPFGFIEPPIISSSH